MNSSGCSSSSSSPEKKRSRLSASSPVTIVNVCSENTSPKPEKESNEQSTSATIPSWVAGASPAKFVSLEELIRMDDSFERMNIAHKIATDPNYKIEDFETDDSLYVSVKSNMRKAYWDLLREDLSKDPPSYVHAFPLLEDLKKMLADHLEGEHLQNALGAMNEILDLDRLRSRSDQDELNFESVLKAVLGVVEKLCAPIRDEIVANLKMETDVIKLFEGMFSLAEFMQLDMANFKISQNRRLIGSYSAQVEFDEFMKLMESDKSSSDRTKLWFGKILDDFLSSESHAGNDGLTQAEVKELIVKFYLALLTSNPADRIPFPETLKLDEKQLDALSEKFLQLELTLSAIFISANLVGKSVCEGSPFKSELKRDLIMILNDLDWSNSTEKLDNVFVQCEHKCKEAAVEEWDENRANVLRRQLGGLCTTDDPIRVIARKRMCEFIGQALIRTGSPLRIPPGLGIIRTELASLTSRFYAITVHNWNGFGLFYGRLFDQLYEAKKKK